jgi:hypothetical protein
VDFWGLSSKRANASRTDAAAGGGPAFTLSNDALQCSQSAASLELKSKVAGSVLKKLHDEGVIDGWRDELYPAVSSFGEEPLLLVERAAAPLLGIKAYGVHMNGYVRKGNDLYLWVATRSSSKPTWPGRLDHIAAGGQVCS